jgi:two-component system OmpR family response regulator
MADAAGGEILVVDDDPRLRELLRYTLARAGFGVREAANGQEALASVSARPPDLVVLDVLMPELDGLSACRELRARGSRVPVVLLSTRGEELDRVLGLDLGGDDYLPKPFAPHELVARVRAVLRRSRPGSAPAAEVAADGVRVDLVQFRASVDGTDLPLTRTELRMLHAVLARAGGVLDRNELVRAAYDGPHFVSERTVDSHVRGVRAKLRGAGVDRLETVLGVGWRWRTG